MEQLKKIRLNNSKKVIGLKIVISFFLALGLAVILEKKCFAPHYIFTSIDRVILLTGALLFAFFHCDFNLKSMYEFIYKKRYILAGIFLLFVVIMKYSGSSITTYNHYIQPNILSVESSVVLGKERPIRSDEWVVSTQYALSQNMTEDKFSYYSPNARGTNTDMFSSINTPVKDVVSLAKPFNMGFMLFGNDAGLSFWWYGRLVALLLISFELCMVITNKKKLISLCGMLVISFSPAMQWWYSTSIVDMLIFGQLALILIDVFMRTRKQRTKILCALGIFISAISYIFVFYPAWQLPFGYVFVALFIWIIYKNRKEYQWNRNDLILILLVVLAVAGIGIRYYTMSKETLNIILNTSYPGARFETGGIYLKNLFSYVYSMFFPYSEVGNPCEYSGMLSLFPIPMLIAIIYVIRNKKGRSFLLPLLAVSIIYTVWVIIGTPNWFAKISLLYMVESKRMTIPLGLIQIYMMIYLIANFDKETKLIKKPFIAPIALVSALIIFRLAIQSAPEGYIGGTKGFIGGMFVLLSIYWLLSMQEETKKQSLIAMLITVSLIGGITVNPIIKGTSVIYEKPLAKKVQELVKQDMKSVWIADSMGVVGGNYLLSNGAKVINSTNIYPNEALYDIILKERKEENREKWNRYAHMSITIVSEETELELIQGDYLNIKLEDKMLKELGVKYVVSYRDTLESFNSNDIQFEKIYAEDNCFIYEVKY